MGDWVFETLEYLERGGWVMFPLAFCSLVMWLLILDRVLVGGKGELAPHGRKIRLADGLDSLPGLTAPGRAVFHARIATGLPNGEFCQGLAEIRNRQERGGQHGRRSSGGWDPRPQDGPADPVSASARNASSDPSGSPARRAARMNPVEALRSE